MCNLINRKFNSCFEIQKFYFENQRRLRRYCAWESAISISKAWWTGENGFLTLLQLCDTFIPTFDDLTHADLEIKRLISLNTGVEDFTISKFSSVMHSNFGTFRAYRSRTFIKFVDTERIQRWRLKFFLLRWLFLIQRWGLKFLFLLCVFLCPW